MAGTLLEHMLSLPLFDSWRDGFAHLTEGEQMVTPKLPDNDFSCTGINGFLGLSYSAIQTWRAGETVPWQVGAAMNPPFRHTLCCYDVGCPSCPGHTDQNDKSLTILWQQGVQHGGRAYLLAGCNAHTTWSASS